MNYKPLLEIFILWFFIYHVLLFFENTRAIQVLRGIIILLLAFFLFDKLNFAVLDWFLSKIVAISVIALLIIFHPEIRQGLARLGERQLFGSNLRGEELDSILKEVGKAVDNLSKKKIGALIVIEKNDPLAAYIETGVRIDGKISSDLIETVFTPNSLLHDGGLVIQHGRIMAAGCLFPLSQSHDLDRVFGTRHRAALGLSEETDALVIIVSEERQDVSLVYNAKLFKDLSREEMFSKIKELFKKR
jgi:diadenylate cyclase